MLLELRYLRFYVLTTSQISLVLEMISWVENYLSFHPHEPMPVSSFIKHYNPRLRALGTDFHRAVRESPIAETLYVYISKQGYYYVTTLKMWNSMSSELQELWKWKADRGRRGINRPTRYRTRQRIDNEVKELEAELMAKNDTMTKSSTEESNS